MKMKFNYFFYLLFLFSLITSVFAGNGSPYKSLVFFGDSLTDPGNLYRSDFGYLPKSPPYFQGRFSNGYVWAELLAKDTPNISSTNYAVGGETAILHPPTGGYLPVSLDSSISLYLSQSTINNKNAPLFFIWIGANDYLPDEIKATDDFNKHVEELTGHVVANIQSAIEKLINYGGMNFIVINLPDFAKTPFGILSGKKHLLKSLAQQHNIKLSQLVNKIQESYPQINIQLFDANTPFTDLVEKTAEINKKNHLNINKIMVSCWEGGYTLRETLLNETLSTPKIEMKISTQLHRTSMTLPNLPSFNENQFAQYVSQSPALREAFNVSLKAEEGTTACENPDEYIFWDKVHPTAIIHFMLSKEIGQFVKEKFTA